MFITIISALLVIAGTILLILSLRAHQPGRGRRTLLSLVLGLAGVIAGHVLAITLSGETSFVCLSSGFMVSIGVAFAVFTLRRRPPPRSELALGLTSPAVLVTAGVSLAAQHFWPDAWWFQVMCALVLVPLIVILLRGAVRAGQEVAAQEAV